MKREFAMLLGGWLLLAALFFGIGWQNLSSPGLFYDEAIYGGLTKDFLAGHANGGHMPGVSTTEIFGGPFPIFVQPYLGALKCWLLIPIFKICGSTLAVLRASNLFFCAVALLIFMLWTWRLLGLAGGAARRIAAGVGPGVLFSRRARLGFAAAEPALPVCRIFICAARVAAAIGALGFDGGHRFRPGIFQQN